LKFAIVDIETTGAFSHYNAITEIGIIITDGKTVLNRYETLVQPDANIPGFITALTGIDDAMVKDAPTFESVASEIFKITQGCIFVAHNVGFDYGFIRKAFKSIGVHFYRKKICTVRMAKVLLPDLSSYSLGRISHQLDLPHYNKHRAMGDAEATFHLLQLLLNKPNGEAYIPQALQKQSVLGKLPPNLPVQDFEQLPEEPGVYHFIDEKGQMLYTGKAKNIRQRIITHLNSKSKKQQKLQRWVHHLSFEITGSNLIAELLESELIKKHLPLLNTAQRRNKGNCGIIEYEDFNGYKRLAVTNNCANIKPLVWFSNLLQARAHLQEICAVYQLCPKLCGLQKAQAACFSYKEEVCKGACIQKESTKLYNKKVKRATKEIQKLSISLLIFDKGRNENERSLVLVKNGKYVGYGYIPKSKTVKSLKSAEKLINSRIDNRDVQRIIHSHINKGKLEMKVF